MLTEYGPTSAKARKPKGTLGSQRVIVPMKRITTVEGRTRGEIDLGGETLTGETKPELKTETKLKRIAQQSAENPEVIFDWLMPHYNKESLSGCYRELDGRKAVGVDRQTKEEYGRNLDRNIEDLIERMKRMAYRPGPVREKLIPKEGKSGEYRQLGIGNFEDKIVQSMTRKILEAIYEPTFLDCSYGFRPNRNCHMAIKDLYMHLYNEPCSIVIDVDLRNFFGTIDHRKLIKVLEMRIKDEKFNRYIVRMLKAGILSDGELKMTEEGSPQGSPSSPILANIYAHYAIDRWFQEVVVKQARGKVKMFRYADDMVICSQYQDEAEKILRALKLRLEKYGLTLNEDKTKLVPFDKSSARKGNHQGNFDFLGFTYYFGRSRKGYMTPKLKTSKKRLRSKLQKVKEWIVENRCRERLKPLWETFTIKLAGHIRYYGVSFNTRSVHMFLCGSTRIFFKWINRRSQRKSFNWDLFNLFMKRYPLPTVRVYHPLFEYSRRK